MRSIERVSLLLWGGGDGVEANGFFAGLIAAVLQLFNLLVDQFSRIPRLWEDIAASLVGKLEEALPPEHPSRSTLLLLVQLAMAVVLILGPVLLPCFVCSCVALLVTLVRALAVCLLICVVEFGKLIRALVVGVWECALGAWKMVKACCGRSVLPSKIMKAPGRPSVRIPRIPFEADPKAYFIGLRASGRALRIR